LGLCLFPEDDYAEVARKVIGSLDRFGCWDASWSPPTAGYNDASKDAVSLRYWNGDQKNGVCVHEAIREIVNAVEERIQV